MPVKIVDNDPEQTRRFRELALPYLDDVYTLARYLLRDAADADDAVQECYLRALKHFHTYQGPSIKPWLFAILRNVCHAEYARRAGAPSTGADELPEDAERAPLWQEAQETPEARIVKQHDGCLVALERPPRERVDQQDVAHAIAPFSDPTNSSSAAAPPRSAASIAAEPTATPSAPAPKCHPTPLLKR